MAKRIGPAKIKQYSLELKLKAVQVSDQPGVSIKDVKQSLCIHPFMLSARPPGASYRLPLRCPS